MRELLENTMAALTEKVESSLKVGQTVNNIGVDHFKKPMKVSKIEDGLAWVVSDDGKELGPFSAPLKGEYDE